MPCSGSDRECAGWVSVDNAIVGVDQMVGGEYCIRSLLDGGRLKILLDFLGAGWRWRFGRSCVPPLAIHVSLGSGQGFRKVASDSLSCESGPGDKMVFGNRVDGRGWGGAECTGMEELE